MSELSLETCTSNLKSVALTILELLLTIHLAEIISYYSPQYILCISLYVHIHIFFLFSLYVVSLYVAVNYLQSINAF